MNHPEKWTPGFTAASKVRAVARHALAARLGRVAKNLKQAARNSENQAENIHRLRTWSRRSAAAVELFRPLLPKQEAKWLADKLKKVRRAAGVLRDLDVMLEETTGDTVLAAELQKQRASALKPLSKLYQRLIKSGRFSRRQRRLLRDIEQPKERLGKWGARRAGKQAAALVALGERSLQHLSAAHAFRIACKELRYVLEIMGGSVPAAATQVYSLLGDLQQRLGVICDQAASEMMYQELLTKVGHSHQPPLRDALSKAKKEKTRRHRAFLRWWTPRRRASWLETLTRAGLM